MISLVGVAGFEPATLLVPSEVRYQTALRCHFIAGDPGASRPRHEAGARDERSRLIPCIYSEGGAFGNWLVGQNPGGKIIRFCGNGAACRS